MMLHSDEGYQKDVGDPKVMDAILSELKQHPERLARCLLYLFAMQVPKKHCVSQYMNPCIQSLKVCLKHLVTTTLC